jgi:hypothetical protein
VSSPEAEARKERLTQVAIKLMKLGISDERVSDLMNHYELDLLEKQLAYLPYRKARRPEAMLIESVRRNYSAPKEIYHAYAQVHGNASRRSVDETPQQPSGSDDAQAA